MGKLEGKVAIVTGAGQGIGRGIALAFAKEDAKVVIAEINPETAKAVEEEIRRLGGEALAVACDVAQEEDIKRAVSEALRAFGAIDILVNNAIKTGPRVPVEQIEEAAWDRCFQTGPKATWRFCKAVFPHMKDRGGKIINIGSLASERATRLEAAYGAAKAAIRSFSKITAREWGKYRINVNVILPTAQSPSFIGWTQRFPEEAKELLERQSIVRAGAPGGDPERDIGRAAVFLASEDSDFITGQTLIVDGGGIMP